MSDPKENKSEKRRGLASPTKQLPAIKKEIRSKVEELSIIQVLRRLGDPYDAIIKEFYTEGCRVCAVYAERIVARENVLIEDQTIRVRIKDDRDFLYQLVDDCKKSEKLATFTGDNNRAMGTLLEIAEKIEAKGQDYSWLLLTYFTTLKRIVSRWEGLEYNNSKCQIFYRYGKILSEKGKKFSMESIEKLTEALHLSKGTAWTFCMDKAGFLHQEIATLLSTVLLKEATLHADLNPDFSANFAKRAVLVLSEDGIMCNKKLYIDANLKKSRYLIFSKNCEEAEVTLKKLTQYVMMSPDIEHKCEYYLLYGIANYCRGNKVPAMRKVKKSLKLSEIYSLNRLQAEGNFYLGKLFSENPTKGQEAKNCFLVAKTLYRNLNDTENVRKANYLIGNHHADRIFKSYISHLNNADTDFCHRFRVRNWKSHGVPFHNSDEFDIPKTEVTIGVKLPSYLQRDCLLRSVNLD